LFVVVWIDLLFASLHLLRVALRVSILKFWAWRGVAPQNRLAASPQYVRANLFQIWLIHTGERAHPRKSFAKLMGLRKTPPKGKAKGLSALAGRIILLRYERFVIASARRRHLASADSVA
jgi:hypothetical protein